MLAKRILVIGLIVAVLVVPFTGAHAILQTLSDFLSLGANTVREIQETLDLADEDVREILEELESSISGLMDELEETYQDNLNITIDSLDAVTRSKILEIEGLIGSVNDIIQEDIRLISDEAQNVLAEASLQIRRSALELEQSLENVIIVGGETVAFVLDKAVANAIIIVSIVLLGIGVLLFVWILFRRALPSQSIARTLALVFMLGYVVVFLALIFVPPVRTFVMTSTGIGLQQRLDRIVNEPRILEVRPEQIIIGQTGELEVWGSTLLPNGAIPEAAIGSQAVQFNATSNDLLVVNVSGVTGSTGSTNLTLTYPERDPITTVVRLLAPTPVPTPPDLQILNYIITPSSPTEGLNTQAQITVRNAGGTEARNFIVRWRPFATHPGLSQPISSLAPGASTTLTFNHSYVQPGVVDAIATADSTNSVSESVENNNDAVRRITVQEAPPRRANVTVTFTRLLVHDDADVGGEGEVFIRFDVNGQTARFPASGTRGMDNGEVATMSIPITVTLDETQDLRVFVRGTEGDGGLTGDDDDMGIVNEIFSFSNGPWGQGSHSDRSSCPDGCYTIDYTISVAFIP